MILRAALLLTLFGAAAFWALTIPSRLKADEIASLETASAARGERLFWAGGCVSCHASGTARGEARLKLGGGDGLNTPFGTFVAPNISPHKTDGIGSWTLTDFANAMQKGVSPDGRHYYPAFPYGSYTHMTAPDIADLYAFLKTLPAVPGKAAENSLGFPYNIRRGLGLWKLAFFSRETPVITLPNNADPAAKAGQYLVEGPGHCAQCHSPRTLNGMGQLDTSRWLAGAPSAEGEGKTPGIDPAHLSWSASEIAEYLKTGFTPEYDSVGGAMVAVQRNMAELPNEDLAAMGAYLKALPE